ncbi:MAG TPA: LLM class flavin-dependent oxidoreductase [Polyangiaceae bacterium]|nr:LLM class flavin-dependent oxidoreductase [Polyangiaceae bacterium]
MSSKKQLHLFGFVIHSPMNHTVGSWRHPRNNAQGYSFAEPEMWQEVARTLERGKFDGIFFADQLAAYDTYEGSRDATIRHAVQFPIHDPLLLIPMMAAVTSRIGLLSTLSVSYYAPYMAVRKFSTLDHLTKGRIGWNIVTSFHKAEALNMGFERMTAHDERYARADEYLEVCFKLWNSWEKDALVLDRTKGVFVDPSKVHEINHRGKYFSCPGFSPVTPSPQGHPVLIQAGASGPGRDFCAKWAEGAFTIQLTSRALASYAADIRARASAAGRASPPSVIAGIQIIVGENERAAREKQEELNELVPVEGSLALLSGHTGYDFSKNDLDTHVEDIKDLPGIQGLFEVFTKMHHEKVTLRTAAALYGRGVAQPQIVGDPEQVADQLIALADESGIDGFNITPTYTPGSFSEIVDLVVPVLQHRGVFRKDYSGATLREHLQQAS